MKRLFFTAIALVAFSGVSMAKNGEVKFKAKSNVVVSACTDIYHATYISAKENGANDRQAGAVAWAAYSSCLTPSLQP